MPRVLASKESQDIHQIYYNHCLLQKGLGEACPWTLSPTSQSRKGLRLCWWECSPRWPILCHAQTYPQHGRQHNCSCATSSGCTDSLTALNQNEVPNLQPSFAVDTLGTPTGIMPLVLASSGDGWKHKACEYCAGAVFVMFCKFPAGQLVDLLALAEFAYNAQHNTNMSLFLGPTGFSHICFL